MLAFYMILACKDVVVLDDSAPDVETGEPVADVAAVELALLDDERYGSPLFVDAELVLHIASRDLLVALDPEAPPERWPWQYNTRAVAVSAADDARMRRIDGVGLWLSGDPLAGDPAHVVDPVTFDVVRSIPGGGVDAAMVGGALYTAYPGIWQVHARQDEPGRLEAIAADNSLMTIDPAFCGEVGSHCGEAMAVVAGALWWTDYQGGLYSAARAYHLEDGVLVDGVPEFIAGEAAKHNRMRLNVLEDTRLWVGGVIDCGLILDTATGAQTPYSAADGCGFAAVEGASYHGSAVRVVSLDLALGGGGYGALRVEWLDGQHAGEVEVITLPFADEAYSCWPIAAIGPQGALAVTCDGARGLFLGRITG